MNNRYHESWDCILKFEFAQPYMKHLSDFVTNERSNALVFPSPDLVFNAFKLTPFSEIKVVILGQDPYHNIGQAHGLSFSVPKGIVPPPSLKNIFKELSEDIIGFEIPQWGDLSSWASQGVLLLNTTLTVRAHQPTSHQNQGWEVFTDNIIQHISKKLDHVVFILWGSYARKKKNIIDRNKHFILESAHPSPLSAYRGFFGNRHFSTANQYLTTNGHTPIDWHL